MVETKKRQQVSDVLKRPPHSAEAEQAILGGLMLDNQVWDKIGHKLCDADFYRTEHRLLFQCISNFMSSPLVD